MSQESKVSEVFWPSLKKILKEDAKNFDRLDIKCHIYLESTTVGGQPYKVMRFEWDHRACILPCGHIFGDKCIDGYLEDCIQSRRLPDCPTCRAILQHTECAHACMGVAMPSRQTEMDNVLPTLSEGSRIAEECCMCDLTTRAASLIRKSTVKLPTDHFFTVSAIFPRNRVWVRSGEDDSILGKAKVQQEIKDGPLKEKLNQLESQLKRKHLVEWSSGDLAGLKLGLHISKLVPDS
ncbi:hypothetical protein LCI18_008068 [Fusarium solani-melongenae]|uniref:Uncharacterized protein n=1 Tax=Fusarium solani subsp. cucurbitae TaxID=2747967 RepID=A0ACD3Z7A4_FUSSC|nr:hypothetical protein LCI18_008068 [Fusarium solani-melongenae]